MKVREPVRLLESHGWTLRRIKGSHRRFKHSRTGAVVTVAGQAGKDVPIGTLRAILKNAGLEKEIWKS